MFIGDVLGLLFYDMFVKFGFIEGVYVLKVDDGFVLKGVMIINVVKCLLFENKFIFEEVCMCCLFFEI